MPDPKTEAILIDGKLVSRESFQKVLDDLVAEGKIVRFQRADGEWVYQDATAHTGSSKESK